MATKRMISSTLPNSKKLRRLSSDTVRFLFCMLCVRCDDDAKMDADPVDIRADLFGGRDEIQKQDVEYMLIELGKTGLIIYYEDKNTKNRMLLIPKWKSFNNIQKDRYKPSEIPDPNDDLHDMLTECIQPVNKVLHRIDKERIDKNSTSYVLAEKFLKGFLKNNPESKKNQLSEKQKDELLSKWSVPIDQLLRIDKQKEEDIRSVINYVLNDSFEKAIVLSTDKIRKRFESLLAKTKYVSLEKKKINFDAEWKKVEQAIGNPELKSKLNPEITSTILKMGGWSEIGRLDAKTMQQKYITLRKSG